MNDTQIIVMVGFVGTMIAVVTPIIKLNTNITRLTTAIETITQTLKEYKQQIEGLSRGIPNLEQLLLENQQKLDDRTERLKLGMENYFNCKKQKLDVIGLKPYLIHNLLEKQQNTLSSLRTRLESVSIESVLKRGFAWVTDKHFNTLYDTSHAKRSGELNIRFVDGIVKTKVVEERDAKQFDLFDL